MKCSCGFKFSGPREFRNCNAFITADGEAGVICPDCTKCYISGEYIGKEADLKKTVE